MAKRLGQTQTDSIINLVFKILERRWPYFKILSMDRQGELSVELAKHIISWIEENNPQTRR